MHRLLSSFHTTVGEITIIATPDAELDPAQTSKSVQMRSFNDPAKGTVSRLHSFFLLSLPKSFTVLRHIVLLFSLVKHAACNTLLA